MVRPGPQGGRQVIRDINTVGWHVAVVEPDHGHHGWAYTVGFFQTFDHPEVVVFGLPTDVLRAILDAVGRLLQTGRRFPDRATEGELAPPYQCVFRRVADPWMGGLLPAAAWFYGDRAFTAMQLLWPDRAHQFPWDDGFEADLASFQPLLFHDDTASARVAAFLDRRNVSG